MYTHCVHLLLWSYLFLLVDKVKYITTLVLPIALITHSLPLQAAKMHQHYLMLGTCVTKNLTTRPGGVQTLTLLAACIIKIVIPAMMPSFDGSELCLAVEAFLYLTIWHPLHLFRYFIITSWGLQHNKESVCICNNMNCTNTYR